MIDKDTMNAEVKVRLSRDEKDKLKRLSKEAGVSMSDYVRSIMFSQSRLVLLSEGAEIAKALFLIHTDLDAFRISGSIPEEVLAALTGALQDVAADVRNLTESLSDIHEEADADE